MAHVQGVELQSCAVLNRFQEMEEKALFVSYKPSAGGPDQHSFNTFIKTPCGAREARVCGT